jgi:hypothetical protein
MLAQGLEPVAGLLLVATWTLGKSETQGAKIPDYKGARAFSGQPPRPRAMAPLNTEYGVRTELIQDALAFMDEYEDVFKALAK